MESVSLLDCAGRRRSPATLSSSHQGLPPRNKGLRYPPDPPTVEEIVAVMRAAGDGPEGVRLRGIIVVLWRAGLRISEALALNETDLDANRGSLVVQRGKGDKRREVGMDRWAWMHLDPWLELRRSLPVGRLFCVVRGPTRGRPCVSAGIRGQLHHAAEAAGVRRRFAPHQLRHARGRDVPRGDLAARDPAPARACRPGDHIEISARDRQHRDHRRGPRTACSDDPGRPTTRPSPLRDNTRHGVGRGTSRCDVAAPGRGHTRAPVDGRLDISANSRQVENASSPGLGRRSRRLESAWDGQPPNTQIGSSACSLSRSARRRDGPSSG